MGPRKSNKDITNLFFRCHLLNHNSTSLPDCTSSLVTRARRNQPGITRNRWETNPYWNTQKPIRNQLETNQETTRAGTNQGQIGELPRNRFETSQRPTCDQPVAHQKTSSNQPEANQKSTRNRTNANQELTLTHITALSRAKNYTIA